MTRQERLEQLLHLERVEQLQMVKTELEVVSAGLAMLSTVLRGAGAPLEARRLACAAQDCRGVASRLAGLPEPPEAA